MSSKWLISALLVAALAPGAAAQMRGGGFGRAAAFGGHFGRGFGRNTVFFGDPYLYGDYPSGSLVSEMPSAPIVLQSAPEPEPKRESLLIELQGDQYVRVRGDGQGTGKVVGSEEAATIRSASAATGARELPPALLIFRDGHQEQVQDYVIASGTLYARADYWQSGSWRKEIQLSALDLPATLQANQDHGVKFTLPSGPNEVVTRP